MIPLAPYVRSLTLAELIEKGRELAPADRVKLAHELLQSVEESAQPDPAMDAA